MTQVTTDNDGLREELAVMTAQRTQALNDRQAAQRALTDELAPDKMQARLFAYLAKSPAHRN